MTNSDVIAKHRQSLLIFAERNSISEACRMFGYSRTTFYKIKKQFLETGALAPKKRRKPRMPNETVLSKKKVLFKLIKEHPMWGPRRYSYAFRKQGIAYAPNTIWYHLKKFGLNHRHRRLVYLEVLKQNNQPIT
ncbi:helix-turn-helix domain-containing protein, partial [Chlamydiota bacterium]